MAWTKLRTWVPGDKATAALMNEQIRDNFREVGQDDGLAAAWTTYTPSWGYNFTSGNGTVTASYMRIGRTVLCRGIFTWGTTTAASANSIFFSLPIAPGLYGVGTGNGVEPQIPCILNDSGTRRYLGMFVPVSQGIWHSEGAFATATSPFTWTTGDSITWCGSYEAAN